jgi:hemolysin activation/secretion protein
MNPDTLNLNPKLEGQIGPVEYELGLRRLRAEAMIRDLYIQATARLNGNVNLKAEMPLFGGNLSFDANRRDGNNSYYLQYSRPFGKSMRTP